MRPSPQPFSASPLLILRGLCFHFSVAKETVNASDTQAAPGHVDTEGRKGGFWQRLHILLSLQLVFRPLGCLFLEDSSWVSNRLGLASQPWECLQRTQRVGFSWTPHTHTHTYTHIHTHTRGTRAPPRSSPCFQITRSGRSSSSPASLMSSRSRIDITPL